MASVSSDTIAFFCSFPQCCQRGCLQAPRLGSPWCSDWGTPLPVPPSHHSPPSTGLGQKVPSPGVMEPKQLLCVKFCFLGTAVAKLGDWRSENPQKKDTFIPSSLQISGWWISWLWSHDYYILLGTSCFSKSGPVAGWIVPWTPGRIKEMWVPVLAAVLGDLWSVILYDLGEPGQLGRLWYNWIGTGGANNFLKAKHHCLFASLSACWWGLCLFLSSSAQTQLLGHLGDLQLVESLCSAPHSATRGCSDTSWAKAAPQMGNVSKPL